MFLKSVRIMFTCSLADPDLFGLDNFQQSALYEKSIIGRAVCRGKLFNGTPLQNFGIQLIGVFDNFPGRLEGLQLFVDSLFSGFPFVFSHKGPSSAFNKWVEPAAISFYHRRFILKSVDFKKR